MSDRVTIAVMGPTGTGKSSFIKRLTGRNDIAIGHGLESETTKVESYALAYNGIRFTLVDTPGFDDSSGSDTGVVEAILAWLKVSVDEDQQLSGIVYMHDIRQPRITNTARQNMRMFKQLCGNDNFQNVVLCTTFWGVVELGSAVTHEAQLLNDPQFWKPMATRGSRSFRLTQDRSLDLQVINHISSRNSRFLAQAQLEMRSGRALHETSTAASMPPELAKLRRYYEGEISAFWKRQQSNQQSMEQAALEEHQRAQERMQQRRRQELTALAAEEARRETERQQLEEAHAREMSKQREVINRANAEWEATARQAVLQRIQRKAESDQEIDATAREQARLAEQNRRCIRACTKRRKCSKCGQRLDQNGWLSCYRKKSPSSRIVVTASRTSGFNACHAAIIVLEEGSATQR